MFYSVGLKWCFRRAVFHHTGFKPMRKTMGVNTAIS